MGTQAITRRNLVGFAGMAVGGLALGGGKAFLGQAKKAPFLWGCLLHLGSNMWDDFDDKGPDGWAKSEEEKKKFDYGVTSSEETWAAITNVSRRISALLPVLIERTGVQPPRPEIVSGPAKDAWLNDSVSQLLKEHDGWRYLLTVNSTDQAVTACFRVKAEGDVSVMSEHRSIKTTVCGTFTDSFAPYAVHVYRFR